MKNPCTSCHWLKKLFCIIACKEYDDYNYVTSQTFPCECNGTISFYPALGTWECNMCDTFNMDDHDVLEGTDYC